MLVNFLLQLLCRGILRLDFQETVEVCKAGFIVLIEGRRKGVGMAP